MPAREPPTTSPVDRAGPPLGEQHACPCPLSPVQGRGESALKKLISYWKTGNSVILYAG